MPARHVSLPVAVTVGGGAVVRCRTQQIGVVSQFVRLDAVAGSEVLMQLSAGGDAELGENVAEVVFDGFWGDEEAGGYFAVGEVLADQVGDFAFFGSEVVTEWWTWPADEGRQVDGQAPTVGLG